MDSCEFLYAIFRKYLQCLRIKRSLAQTVFYKIVLAQYLTSILLTSWNIFRPKRFLGWSVFVFQRIHNGVSIMVYRFVKNLFKGSKKKQPIDRKKNWFKEFFKSSISNTVFQIYTNLKSCILSCRAVKTLYFCFVQRVYACV